MFSKSPYITNNTNIFGFPLTNKDQICLLRRNKNKNRNILYFTKKNLIDMDNENLLKKLGNNTPEIIVDFSKNIHGNMVIRLNFNKSLSEKRKKMEKNSNAYSNNIILLYFDSISRNTGLRQLKKTLKFIEDFMSYKGKYNKKTKDTYHSFQFLKYHSFKYYTRGNYPKLFYWADNSKKK